MRRGSHNIGALLKWKREHIRPLPDRFWEKVQKADGCWLWSGCRNHLGYGQIANDCGQRPRVLMAHRAAWMLSVGPIPDGGYVLHGCDNPRCVNPAHLRIGTQRDNMHDAINKGRFKFPKPSPGTTNVNAKLNPRKVRSVRAAYASGATLSQLSRQYKMARATLRAVVRGDTWHEG